MTFASPSVLWALLALPLAVGLYALAVRRRARHAVRFTRLDLLGPIAAEAGRRRRLLPPFLFLLALAAFLLGSARPHASVRVPRQDATVILTLDSSGSMKAADVEPDRLTAAKSAAKTFLEQLPETFQVGVVSFANSADVLTQPTVDRSAVRSGISSLQAAGATAMGDALVEAIGLDPRARPGSENRSQGATRARPLAAIVLLSDGYNTSGEVEPLEAAAIAEQRGIPVFTIALGTPDGVVQLPSGEAAEVPPDYATLEAIAEQTGGRYFTAPSDSDLRAIYESLGSRIGFVSERREVTVAFAAVGLLVALAATILSARWSGAVP